MSKKHKDKKQPPVQSQAATSIFAAHPSDTDRQGSYTGRPVNAYEVPVQDADDL